MDGVPESIRPQNSQPGASTGAGLDAQMELDATLRELARAARVLLRLSYVAIVLWRDGEPAILIQSSGGRPAAAPGVAPPRTLLAEYLRRAEPLIVETAGATPEMTPLVQGLASTVGVRLPLAYRGVEGVLFAGRTGDLPAITPEDAANAAEIAHLAAAHVERALRLETTLRRSTFRQAVARTGLGAGGLASAIEAVLGVLTESTSIADVETWAIDPLRERIECVARVGAHGDLFVSPSLALGEGVPGAVAGTGAPIFAEDLGAEPQAAAWGLREQGLGGFFALPLIAESQVIGVLCCAFRGTGVPSADLALVGEAAPELGQLLLAYRAETERAGALAGFRYLVENLPLTTYTWNLAEGMVTLHGPVDRLGLAPVLTRDDWLAQVYVDDRVRVRAMQEDATGGRGWSTGYRFVSRDGRLVWVHDEATVTADAGGRPRFAYGFLSETSAQEEAAAGTQRSLRELEELLAAMPSAVITTDAGGRVTRWSPVATRLFGWGEDEALGTPLPTIPGEAWAEFLELRDRVVRGEIVRAVTMPWVRQDGTSIEVECSFLPLRQGGQEIVGMTVLAAALGTPAAGGEVRLRSLIEAWPQALIATDLEGQVRVWNLAAERLLGWPATEVIGAPFPLDEGGTYRELKERVLLGESPAIETVAPRPDGAPADGYVNPAPPRGGAARV